MRSIGTRLSMMTIAIACLLPCRAGSATSPGEKCELTKLKAAGVYGACRLKAEATALKKDALPVFDACDEKLMKKWDGAETAAGPGICPSEDDGESIRGFIAESMDDVAAALAGEGLPSPSAELLECQTDLVVALECGDGNVDAGEDCDLSDLGGATCISQGFVGGILACGSGCTFDVSGCSSVRFVDHGNDTVTDMTTGLMWTKHSAADDLVHTLTWADAMLLSAVATGTVGPSGGTSLGGHADWRLPTSAELQTLLLAPEPCATSPCIDPAMGPTAEGDYWTSTWYLSTTTSSFITEPLAVDFSNGSVTPTDRNAALHARLVRKAW